MSAYNNIEEVMRVDSGRNNNCRGANTENYYNNHSWRRKKQRQQNRERNNRLYTNNTQVHNWRHESNTSKYYLNGRNDYKEDNTNTNRNRWTNSNNANNTNKFIYNPSNLRISRLEREVKRLKRLLREKDTKLFEKDEEILIKGAENDKLRLKIQKLKQKRKSSYSTNESNVMIVEGDEIDQASNRNSFEEDDEDLNDHADIDDDGNNSDENENLEINVNSNRNDEQNSPTDNNSIADPEIDPDEMTYEQLLELQEKIGFVSRGFSENQIEQIPIFKYTKKRARRHSMGCILCTICQYDYQKGDQVRQFSCLHAFHSDCVFNWLKKEKICPNCKEEILIN